MRFRGLRSSRLAKPLRFLMTALIACSLLLVFDLRSPAAAMTPQHYTELEFPPLQEVQIPEYERFELDNGMVVYLMEDHELPLVSGNVIFRAGSAWEPAEKAGLASITGQVMRSGGTEAHPPDVLNQLLEQRAASVETSIGTTAGNASFSALSEDLDTVFNLFAEVLKTPAFAPDKVDLSISQYRSSIARRNDDPDEIARREFDKLVYGSDSPYARTAEYSTLAKITRDDVIAFYQQYLRPEDMILGIVGDIDTAEMKALVEETFGSWQPATETVAALEPPSATQAHQGGVFLVNQPQLTQSSILVGHLGGRFDNPDYPALSVLNGVLNGFGGRLFNEVRSRQGLAYSVYAFWSGRFDYPGEFIGGGQTRSEATVPFVQSVISEIERVRQTPVTPEELAYAKESELNSFVFSFASPDQTLSRLMRYEYYGYPADFLFKYQEAVEATTAEEVLQAAQEHLHPDRIITLVVGNAEDIQPPLSTLMPQGEVNTIDVTIPEL